MKKERKCEKKIHTFTSNVTLPCFTTFRNLVVVGTPKLYVEPPTSGREMKMTGSTKDEPDEATDVQVESEITANPTSIQYLPGDKGKADDMLITG